MIITRNLPSGNILTIDANHTRGYFSVTATERQSFKGREVCGGQMHPEVLQACPWLAPIVALHLSNAQTGAPMHAEANGYYWLAGACGGLSQAHHGANDGHHTQADCERILAEHLRVSLAEVLALVACAHAVADVDGLKACREWWAREVVAMGPRWAAEAQAGRELLAAKAAQYAAAGAQL